MCAGIQERYEHAGFQALEAIFDWENRI